MPHPEPADRAWSARVVQRWSVNDPLIVMSARQSRFMHQRPLVVLLLAFGFAGCASAQDQPPVDGAVALRGGTFLMGTAIEEVEPLKARYELQFPGVFEDETPVHAVTISDFSLDRQEVTNARFLGFVGARPEWRKAAVPSSAHNGRYLEDWTAGRPQPDRLDHPVVFVTWHAAQAFCLWAGGRLPTEAEWEYAARAGGDAEFPWGEALPSPEAANYSASKLGTTVAVGSYPANEWGLQDLAGNVWEFVLDEWVTPYAPETQVDPVVGGTVAEADLQAVEGRRALRGGGSFNGAVANMRTRWRDSHQVTNAVEFVGFRCAYPGT